MHRLEGLAGTCGRFAVLVPPAVYADGTTASSAICPGAGWLGVCAAHRHRRDPCEGPGYRRVAVDVATAEGLMPASIDVLAEPTGPS
jgi:hypothetical protein